MNLFRTYLKTVQFVGAQKFTEESLTTNLKKIPQSPLK